MRRATLLIAMLVLTPLTTAAGQGATAAPGARIRVSAQGLAATRVVGTVVALRADTLVLAPQNGRGLLALPLESVQRLEVSRGRSSVGSTVMKHAGIGLLVGAASGALAGPYVLSSACITPEKDLDAHWQCFDDLADGEARLKATVLFGIAGTAIGAVVGAIVGRERWEKVAQDQVRVSFAPQRDGSFALRTSVRF